MGDELIPPDVREFILRHIDSIAHLEALLLLLQQPDIKWSAASVADNLYIEPDQAVEVLQHLCETGLAGCNDAVYWFNAEPVGQLEVARRLAELYSKSPHTGDQSRPRQAVGYSQICGGVQISQGQVGWVL